MNLKSYILNLLLLPKSATFVIFGLTLLSAVEVTAQTPPGISILELQTPPGISIVTFQTPPGIGK